MNDAAEVPAFWNIILKYIEIIMTYFFFWKLEQ